jgi:Trk-type K+ transport system membrane component
MLVLFIVTLIVSFVVVRIGAIAFQLTGLEWSLAKFQALSCYSGTGFTTKEAELVTGNKQRRKIATILIILGNAGFVIMIATLAGSLMPTKETIVAKFSESFLPSRVPASLVVWINLAIIIAVVYGIYRIFTHEKFVRKMTNILRKKIIKKEIFQKVSFEELLLATGGYGISRITVSSGSPVLNKTLAKSQLREYDITVLAAVRGGETIPNPQANMKILLSDELICFGKLENIKNRISMNPF